MTKFVPRQRKHKVLQKQKHHAGKYKTENGDTNVAEILPAVDARREKKKMEMKAALKAQQPAISGKKQKRLEKYLVRTLILKSSVATNAFHRTKSYEKKKI